MEGWPENFCPGLAWQYHRLNLLPAGRKPAVEEDQGERDDADRLREIDRDEVDKLQTFRADGDPENEKEHESRHARTASDERGCDRQGEQNPDEQY